MEKVVVADLVQALDTITGGRLPKTISDLYNSQNPFVVVKSSNLPGKAVTETPGLVFGDPEMEIKKVAVMMTMTESAIELAGSTDVNAILAHHPIADAANSGGVLIKTYLGLYKIAALELHEAFHGLHPGISYIHGHAAYRVEVGYGGVSGNILYVGKALDEVNTLGDILDRIKDFMNIDAESEFLKAEQVIRNCVEIEETSVAVQGEILLGKRDSKVENILHIFPHTGFSPQHLENVMRENPEIDTILASISRVKANNPLVVKAKELGLNFIVGNPHSLEIFENGMPLARAIKTLLPSLEVVIFRERMCSVPIDKFGSDSIQKYADMITEKYLLKTKK
ncbi:MAG: NGG1p interacting factor 3 protein, NIF3 [Peptococcaceae bacterium BICA1-8]|nr:MAG: NGG1p interacting factor 3 protein, NIF3 [Peptococcaceae bacterium BICA1-8]